MIGRFFGLSAATLALSPIGPSSYMNMVDSLDSPSNREILYVLKEDIERLLKFLDNLPTMYEDPMANRAAAMLRTKRYSSDEERLELEKSLEGKKKVISTMMVSQSKELSRLSEGAYKIIKVLYDNRDRLTFFLNNIKFANIISGVTVFGEKLYILRLQSRSVLVNRVSRLYKSDRGLDRAKLESLSRDVDTLKRYLSEGEELGTQEIMSKVSNLVEEQISNMDVEYFNNKLDLQLTEDEYFAITEELYKIGLVGFTTLNKESYDDFKSSISFSGKSDLNIYPNQDLFRLTLDLNDVVENYKKLERR